VRRGGGDFWRGWPERVKSLGSSMSWCSKSATAAERYAAIVVAMILGPLLEFPSPTHWPYVARVRLTVSGPCLRRVPIGRLI
jgi:hypothetical protein